MVMIQTTNDVFNNSLYKFVSSNSLLAWHRVRLANLMAHSGKEWSDVYKQYNSGRSLSICCLGAVLQCCESSRLPLRVSRGFGEQGKKGKIIFYCREKGNMKLTCFRERNFDVGRKW